MRDGAENRHVDRVSADIAAQNLNRLREIFPEAFRDNELDLVALRECVGDTSDESIEKYGLRWVGRQDSIRLLQKPSSGTLTPDRTSSARYESPNHVWIAGENLEVLKVLYRSYHDTVKAIYIDPPYNTGKDFVYKDNFSAPLREYLLQTGQLDEAGQITTSEVEQQGRRHSKWLSMMYPRLKLAHQLLRQDGIIFVSIDDNEEASLRLLLDEIFGESNRLGSLIWHLGTGPTAGHFLRSHEAILCYARDKSSVPNFVWRGGGEVVASALKRISAANPASNIRFPAGLEIDGGGDRDFPAELGGTITQTVVEGQMRFRNGKLTEPVVLRAGWAMKTQIESWLRGDETYDTQGQRVLKLFFSNSGMLMYEKERTVQRPRTVIQDVGSTAEGSADIERLGLPRGIFDFPKPVALIQTLVGWVTDPQGGELVLDFFAGSGTTAHAVARLNASDGGNRRTISIQFPEALGPDTVGAKAGFKTLADVGAARVAAALDHVQPDATKREGMRALILSESNFATWESPVDRSRDSVTHQLGLSLDSVKVGTDTESVAYEVALREGYGLSIDIDEVGKLTKVIDRASSRHFWLSVADQLELDDVEAARVAEGDLLVCRDRALTDTTAANLELRYRLKTI